MHALLEKNLNRGVFSIRAESCCIPLTTTYVGTANYYVIPLVAYLVLNKNNHQENKWRLAVQRSVIAHTVF